MNQRFLLFFVLVAAPPFTLAQPSRLVQSGARLSHADLYAIVRGVLSGLVELKKVARRSHGALKPSNVFLTAEGRAIASFPLRSTAGKIIQR